MRKLLCHLAIIVFFSPSLFARADTFSGTVSFSDLSDPSNNFFTVSGVADQPAFSFSGTVGTTYTDNLTLTTTQLSAAGSTSVDVLATSINFSSPGSTGTTFVGTGGVFTLSGQCCLLSAMWSQNTETIAFADGSSVLLTLPDTKNLQFSPSSQSLTFSVLTDATDTGGGGGGSMASTPEPSSFVLLGTGILGFGAMLRRKHTSGDFPATKFLLACFLCVFSVGLKANATPILYIQGSANTSAGPFAINKTANPAKASMQLSDTTKSTAQAPGFSENSQIALRASFGNLGAAGLVVAGCGEDCGGASGTAQGQVESVDDLFISGASSSDSLALRFVVEGDLVTASGMASVNYRISGGGDPLDQECADFAGVCSEQIFDPGMAFLSLTPDNVGTLTAEVDQVLMISARCLALPDNEDCNSNSSFSDTAIVGDARIVDANGNLVSGATITSASGYDYTQSLSATSPVPEPPSLSLLAIGMLLLLGIISHHKAMKLL